MEVSPQEVKAGDLFHSHKLDCTVIVEGVEKLDSGGAKIYVKPYRYRTCSEDHEILKIEVARIPQPPDTAHARGIGEIWIERNRYWAKTSDGSIVGPCLSRLQAENELDDWEEADSQ